MNVQKMLLTAMLLLPGLSVSAQDAIYKSYDGVKVYDTSNNEQTLAWAGGFNNPQFSMGDLNNDGLQDLVVFEPYKGVKTFINKGTAGNPNYVYSPEYAANFPPVYQYLVLADYNSDGIADMFQQGSSNIGFVYFKGYYNSNNQLCFIQEHSLNYTNDTYSNGSVNAFNNPGDIPAIVDVDNDGDLDFLSYDIAGGNINFYKNMRVELNLPKDSILIELKDRCWGKVYQGFYRTHVLGYDCSEAGLNRQLPENKKTHVGNTPCLFDYDGDGDYDYLDGSISFNEMTFLLNGKAQNGGPDSMIYQDTFWQSNGHVIELPLWPAAFNVDVDQDGKKDLLISPNAAGTSENYKCVWYYKNNSTPGHPSFVYQTNTYLIDDMIDLGTAAYPTLFDYNKDGKPDLFIGSDGYYQSDGTFKSRISYYKNTSTPGSPSFVLQTTDFLGLSANNYVGTAPTIGDINNDGKADMIIGHSDGTLSYFSNNAANDSAQPVWVLAKAVLTDVNGDTINVNDHAAPLIYDVNKDGKPDLVIGELSGSLQYYQNTSTTPGQLSLTLQVAKLGNVKVDARDILAGYSTPFIGRVDNSGKDYLLVGSGSGDLYRYTGFQTGDVNATYTMLDSQFAYIDSQYLSYNHLVSNAAYSGLRSAPVIGDIDGDGTYEMIVGNTLGGVKLYEQTGQTGVNTLANNKIGAIQLYPNPARETVTVSWDQQLNNSTSVSIINMEGQTLSSVIVHAGENIITLPVNTLIPGVYVCLVQSGDNRSYSRFTVLR